MTCYLTEPAVRATLRRIASALHPRTSVIFDTVGKVMAAGASSHDDDRRTGDLVHTLGEPVRWGTNDPLPLLYDEGFLEVSVVSFDQATLEYERREDADAKAALDELAAEAQEHDLGY